MIVGLTGGIGSGKTTVAKLFNALGVPIFVSDIEAKKIMNNNNRVKSDITQLLGSNAYIKGQLNKTYVANLIFNDKDLLNQLNQIVHPAVGDAFKVWYSNQVHPYVIKESAILFESKGHLHCDFILTVTASLESRIQRVMLRDEISKSQVEDRIKNQIPEEYKIQNSDFVIVNDDLDNTKSQVLKINIELLNKS